MKKYRKNIIFENIKVLRFSGMCGVASLSSGASPNGG